MYAIALVPRDAKLDREEAVFPPQCLDINEPTFHGEKTLGSSPNIPEMTIASLTFVITTFTSLHSCCIKKQLLQFLELL